jgi:hypothetical protein
MICFVSKRVASKSSVKATICRSLIVFMTFTSLFDLAGGGSIEISPGGRNRVFISIPVTLLMLGGVVRGPWGNVELLTLTRSFPSNRKRYY